MQSTPLFLACSKGHQSVAEVLMEKGADVTAQSGEKLNCLEVAVKNGHMYVVHCTCVDLFCTVRILHTSSVFGSSICVSLAL